MQRKSKLNLIILGLFIILTSIGLSYAYWRFTFISDKANKGTSGCFNLEMTDQKDENGNLLPDDVRLTKFGKMLRSTSLDELPELINIIKGDMAVVGPRPLLVSYLPLYNEHQARRHEVRPGFTGYAQVHGRNSITWEDKFDKDVYYVDHISFIGDWKITFRTIKTVLKREGISSSSSVTMEPFRGSNT